MKMTLSSSESDFYLYFCFFQIFAVYQLLKVAFWQCFGYNLYSLHSSISPYLGSYILTEICSDDDNENTPPKNCSVLVIKLTYFCW